jgi:flagellar motor switch protein FliM
MTAPMSSPPSRERVIHSCNFRYAGRLSNENARALTSLHEKFALSTTNSLEAYLGATMRLKLLSLEQLSLQDYITGIAPKTSWEASQL